VSGPDLTRPTATEQPFEAVLPEQPSSFQADP
jgi:hypothetical protein